MKPTRRRSHPDSNFEILSDLSLSTLGLFSIVFVVYALLFNSRTAVQADRLTRLTQQVEDLTQVNQSLIQENQNLKDQNQLTQALADRLDRELKAVRQQNRYTGYYTGTGKTMLYEAGCDRNGRSVSTYYTLFVAQGSDLAIFTLQNEEGTLNLRYRGQFEGNEFVVSKVEFTGAVGLSLCGEDELPFTIEFYDDYLLVQGDRLDRVE